MPVSPVSEATDYDEAKHGVVVFISNTPFMGPHPVLVNVIFRLTKEEAGEMHDVQGGLHPEDERHQLLQTAKLAFDL